MPCCDPPLRLFVREVDVIKNVVCAVAVVACTLGAVTELQGGIGGIRAAADRALVTVALNALFALHLPHIIVEFGGLLGTGPVMPVNKCSSAEFIARGGRIPAPLQSLKN